MQALQICNLMLARSSKRSWPEYRARHYAVTPLGPRSGLIQWVGGATPLFFIYRKWQQRQAQILHSLEKKNGAASAVPEVERPTDMYQKQLRSAFLKHVSLTSGHERDSRILYFEGVLTTDGSMFQLSDSAKL